MAGGGTAFQRALAHWEMQTASSRIWTRVAMSIFSDNHKAKSARHCYDNVKMLLKNKNNSSSVCILVIFCDLHFHSL